ncbi:SH3 domain-containing protein [Joostella sp. CR20]|uniref:SH3 domain-containing protein n=1 Tax=Joostella sp. CR20 TaxID=2804312 RepID=UPI00313D3782
MMKSSNLHSRFLFVIVMICSFIGFAQQQDQFKQANDLYTAKQYQEAIEKYLEITESGQHSAALYYNLANSYYKLNQIAPSIYYYEKALLLAPNDADIQNNLQYAQNMTVDAIDVMPKTGFDKLTSNIVEKLTFSSWGVLAIVCMLVFVIAFLLYYFADYHTKKRVYFTISMLFLLAAVACYGVAYYQYGAEVKKRPAIIFSQEAAVMSEPNMGSTEVFLLHEGTKVNVLDTLGSWRKIKLADGKIGWLPDSDLKEIKDF